MTMATRKIKDLKDLGTGELIYARGHAKATYMSNGQSVEDAINSVVTNGKVVKVVETIPSEGIMLYPNTTYVVDIALLDVTISGFEATEAIVDEYTLQFSTFPASGTLTLPSNVRWANGVTPTLEGDTLYELSIVKTRIAGNDYFKAVLTPFK